MKYTIALAALVLAGCASPSSHTFVDEVAAPPADASQAEVDRYQANLVECRRFARSLPGASGAVAGGGLAGALLGALLGGMFNGEAAAWGAGVGAISGAGQGASAAEMGQRGVTRQCLLGRGYQVSD